MKSVTITYKTFGQAARAYQRVTARGIKVHAHRDNQLLVVGDDEWVERVAGAARLNPAVQLVDVDYYRG